MSDIIGFNSSITFTGAPGTLPLEDDFNLNNGNPPFIYRENYDRYFSDQAENLQLVPQDLSLYKNDKIEPIKVPSSKIISYSNDYTKPTVNYANPNNSVNVDDFNLYDGFENDQFNYVTKIDLGASGKKVSNDPPEENFTDETAFNDDTFYQAYDDGSIRGQDTSNDVKIASSVDAKSNQKAKPAFNQDLSKIKIDPATNELNTFSSVTYNLALYMMNSKSYVDITKSPNNPNEVLDSESGNSQLLMRSGGTGLDNSNNDFANNFFIDDLEIQNIAVGPDKFKHNTNATSVNFTITEPRGVTLLEKLQRLAGTVLVSTRENYIHAPYLLEIKFKGYNDTGQPIPTASKPKYIPIKITDMTFEVTNSGTQYRVSAIPFANHVLGSIMNTIPHNIELKASTVGDIFSSEVTKLVQVPDRITDGVSPGVATAIGIKEGQQPTKTKKTKHRDLAEILTDSRRARTLPTSYKDKNGQPVSVPPAAEKYDTYNFLLAEEISSAKLNLEDIYDALNTPVPTEDEKKPKSGSQTQQKSADKKQYETYVQGLTRGVTLDKESKTFSIAAGTDITKLINLVIMHSSYMDKNVEENPKQYLQTGDPINWFRVRPVIESSSEPGNGFDRKDGRYKYSIKHVVEKNVIHYHDFPWGKKSKPVGVGYHKVYDFIFSGKNTEVLDFRLKFNTAFYSVMTAGTGSPFAGKPANNAFTPQVKELTSSLEGNVINSKDQLTRQRAKDLFSSVMSDGVDLLNLDMSIVGDPAWIPTSDAYWQDRVRKGQSYTSPFMPDGTINYNLTPPYIRVNLRTPVDYDATTGLQDPSQAGNSSFSGVYRITQVDSTFSGGVFQQRLSGFRPPGQDANSLQGNTNQGTTESATNVQRDLLTRVEDAIVKDSKNLFAKVLPKNDEIDYDTFFPEE
tara:strand:- start:18307 stop:21027 length:2721 start_codon:yes stop_codon:yes gene_type:complete